jgi:hypothetical protein
MASVPTLYDDFTRANATLSAPWAVPTGSANVLPQISSNLVICNNVLGCDAYYNSSVTTNQHVELLFNTIPGGTANAGILFRVNPSTDTYYACIYINGTGIRIYKIVAGASGVQVGGTYAGTFSSGNTMSVSIVGTVFTVYVQGTPVLQVVDSSITTGNYVGIQNGDPGTTTKLGPIVAYAL